MAKAAEGSITVRFWNPPGVYPRQPQRTFKTQREADAFKRRIKEDQARLRAQAKERNIDVSMLALVNGSVRDVGNAWLAQIPSRGTLVQAKGRLENHVYPRLGDQSINTVKPAQVKDLIGWWQEKGMAAATQLSIFANFKSVYTWAMANDLLDGSNPFAKIPTPRVDPALEDAWPDIWVGDVMNGIRRDLSIFPLLCAYLGLRQGEAFGASPEDFIVNRQGKRVFLVRRQVKMVRSALFFAPPKHRKHNDVPREIPVPDFVWDLIMAYIAAHPPLDVTLDYDRNDKSPLIPKTVKLLMTTREGGALNRNYFNVFIWKPTLVGADIPTTRENGTHALRHWFAATALALGMPITQLSYLLGHKDKAFTLKIYGRFQPEGNANVATGFARIGEQLLKRESITPEADEVPDGDSA